jgi:hypothetical protein
MNITIKKKTRNALRVSLAALLMLCACISHAEQYRVSTLRASPGQLESLIEQVRKDRDASGGNVVVMRHSQGDHWDLMLIEPASSAAGEYRPLVDFQLSFIAESTAHFAELKREAGSNGLYHIEMFHALAGKHDALVDQRLRENDYLQATGQTTNHVFNTVLGSDVDVFTLGFHKDMSAFSKGPSVTDAQAEQAALKAGFKNRSDLSYYLRSLLTSHQDTLAVPVN